MTRTLDADVVTAIGQTLLRPRLFVKFEFESGDLRLWNDFIPYTFNGEEYTPTGDFGSISDITEDTELEANGVELSLSGIPSEWISIALAENYKGRPVTVWDALLDSSGALVGGDDGPIPHTFRCDTMRIVEGGDTATITLVAESVLRRLEQGSAARFTPQWQRRILGGQVDGGFNQMTLQAQSEIFWGAERSL